MALQKVKLSDTEFTLWGVEFTIYKSYDKKTFTAEQAKEHFISLSDNLEPYDFEDDSEDDYWYLTTDFCYYACDSGHGGNIINDCLNAIFDDGIKMNQLDYEYKWNKLDISHDHEYIPMALSTYGNDLKLEEEFLIGECLSEFIDNCSCVNCK